MTYAKKRMKEHGYTMDELASDFCPYEFDYERCEDRPCEYMEDTFVELETCNKCWNRKIPGTEVEQMELDGYSHEEVKEMLNVTDDDIEQVIKPYLKDRDDLGAEINEMLETSKKVISYSEAWESFQDAKREFNLTEHMDKLGNAIVQGFCDSIESTVEKQKIILDSGERRQFETGAVRDIQEGKGRCDLMPLNVVGYILEDNVLVDIENFKENGDPYTLAEVLRHFNGYTYMNIYTMFLEVAKHFEEGAKKYGENNWQKGIPTKHYIDSAVRHYLKHLRGDQDEPHDRAFVWNIMCCMWTCLDKEKWTLNDYLPKEGGF